MIEKVQKIRKEIERLKESGCASSIVICDTLLAFIDSLQEEPNTIEDAPATNYEVPRIKGWIVRQEERYDQYGFLFLSLKKPLRNEENGRWFGHECIILEHGGKFESVKWEDEPLEVSLAIMGNPIQEDPVSEELEKAALLYYPKMSRISEPHGIIPADNESHYLGDANEDNRKAFKAGAKWQKEQMMKDAIDVTVHIDAGNYPYIPQMELYDYDKDVPLAKEGDKVKIVLIKED